MNTTRKRILIYAFLLLFIMACRTGACNSVRNVPTSDNNFGSSLFSCKLFLQVSTDPHPDGYSCSLDCPTGPYTFDLYDKEPNEFLTMSLPEVQAQYCPGGVPASSSNLPATEPPTEAPTEPPTEAPTEPALASILGGKVSYCSVNEGQYYLNLPFNSGADPAQVQKELDRGDLKVVIGSTNTAGRCQVLAANKMLLCAFPSGSFPAFGGPNTILNVVDKGTIIDVLLFSNYCQAPQPVNNGGDGSSSEGSSGGGSGSVPACDPHTDPSCPVDCSNPANADMCG